jgi:phosphatidylglycerophosphatase A
MIGDKIQESRTKRGHTLKINNPVDAAAFFVATGFFSGLIPIAPGTFGSLVGLLIVYGLTSYWNLDVILLQNSLIVTSAFLAAIGVWAGTRAEKIFDRKDASQIVIDEVCGQVVSFVFIAPYLVSLGPQWRWWMIAGFLLFRYFDIFKPYPIKDLQQITGGLGVVMDDVIAGIYAAVVMSIVLMFAV